MRTLLVVSCICAAMLTPPSAFAQLLPDERDRRDAIEHYLAGQEWLSAERWDRAEREFVAAIKLYPLMTDAHYGLGQAYMGLERYTSAALAFQQCLEAARKIHGLREKVRVEGDRAALETVDEIRDTIRRRGDGTLRARQLDEYASKLLRNRSSLTAQYQPPAPVLLALGSAHFRAGNRDRAEYYWQEATQLDATLGEAWNNLAAVYASTARRTEAEEAVRQAESAGFRVNPRLKDAIRVMKP